MNLKGMIVKILFFSIGYICGILTVLIIDPLFFQQVIPFAVGGTTFGLIFAGVFEGLPIIMDYRKDKRQRRIKHLKNDIAPTLKNWFTSSENKQTFIAHPSPLDYLKVDSTELSSISFCKGKLNTQRSQEPRYLDYFDETKSHLKDHPNIIKPWNNALSDANTFTEKVEELLSKMEKVLCKHFSEAEFLQLDEEPTELRENMKFWIPWETTWALYNLLLEKNTFHISRYGSDSIAFEAGKGVPYFVSFDRSEVDDMIIKIHQLALQFTKEMDEINELKASVKCNLDTFRNEKRRLIKYIYADKQTKGKCELCS